MPRAMVNAVLAVRTNQGLPVWRWGGNYTGNKDAMHYELVCSPAELAAGIKWSTVPGSAPPDPIIYEESEMFSQEIPPDGRLHAVPTPPANGGAFAYKRVWFGLSSDEVIHDPGVRLAYFSGNGPIVVKEGIKPYGRNWGEFLPDGVIMVSVSNPGPGYVTASVEIEKH
jgi:hypothetical protein